MSAKRYKMCEEEETNRRFMRSFLKTITKLYEISKAGISAKRYTMYEQETYQRPMYCLKRDITDTILCSNKK
jgi:hypothetical protein